MSVFTGQTLAERLVGGSMSDLTIRRELDALDRDAEVIRDEDIYGWMSKSAGLQVGADPDSGEIMNIFLHAQGVANHEQFAGDLPGGVEFDWDRARVRVHLGAPSDTGDDVDLWRVGDATLYVEYADDRVQRVSLIRDDPE